MTKRRVGLAFAIAGSLAGPAMAQKGGAPMALPGAFEVGAHGEASYTVPIAVPPGTAGMEPKLALSYSSQNGNGLAGMGWALTGLPAVTRCPRTLAQDGIAGNVSFDANDRFCLDGQRLVAIAGTYGGDGTEYRTELEGYSRIVSYGSAGAGPAWFKVWTKSGIAMELGNRADSRIEAQGKATARLWSINKTSDTAGNYWTVAYAEDNANGDYRPVRIDYTGNAAAGVTPYASVRFVYAARPDVAPLFQAGSLVRVTQRLANIQTYVGETLVLDLRLAYGTGAATARSRVTSLTLCAGDGACLPATSLAWTDEAVPPFTIASHNLINDFGLPTQFAPIPGDFDGDGRADFAMLGENLLYLYRSNGTGGFTFSSANLVNNFGLPTQFTPIVGDLDGDGRTDLALQGSNLLHVYRSVGDGSFVYSSQDLVNNFGLPTQFTPIIGDFDSDGRTDFAMLGGNSLYVHRSNGDGSFAIAYQNVINDFGLPTQFVPLPGDYNGDGITDFALQGGSTIYLHQSPGTRPDLLGSITSGLGGVTQIAYKTLSQAGAPYVKGGGAIYPVVDLQAPLDIVSEVQTANGIGGNLRTTYRYAGARAHEQGRGFLGFAQMIAKDEQAGIEVTTNFRQDWPFVGLVSSRTKGLGGLALNNVTNSYAADDLGAGRRYVKLTQSVETSNDLDATPMPTVTTSYQYDAFGNATQVVVATGDGYSKTTVNT